MPQSSYLQTIARRAKSHLPVLMPPRAPLSRLGVPLMSEPPDELPPSESSQPINRATIFSRQTSPAIPQKERPSVPSQPFKDLPQGTVIPSPQREQANPALLQPTAPETSASLENSANSAPEDAATQPGKSPLSPAQVANSAPASLTSKPRSYLQTTAKISTLETRSPATEPLESIVVLQPPDRHVGSEMPAFRPPHANQPSRPSAAATSQANTVHIGTIDIHIAPPPAPPIQSRVTGPKPAAPASLARGFTSSFGLRQG